MGIASEPERKVKRVKWELGINRVIKALKKLTKLEWKLSTGF